MKKNNKGFTLVELIVVLVILAILAAMLIPALTGYIDRAQEDKVKTLTRQVVVAAQTVVSEAYGKSAGEFDDGSVYAQTSSGNSTEFQKADLQGIRIKDICVLAEVTEGNFGVDEAGNDTGKFINGITYVTVVYNDVGKVTKVFLGTNNRYCSYDAATGEYTVIKY